MSAEQQGSPEWHAARLGCITASRIADVMRKPKTKGGTSAARRSYVLQLVAERLGVSQIEMFQSSAMVWGTNTEPQARAAYEAAQGVLVAECGFIKHPMFTDAGASPDGLVGNDGLIEIKCPGTTTHLSTLLSCDIDPDYLAQMQWQMACTRRKWCDFVSYDPRLPSPNDLFIKRVFRDDVVIDAMNHESAMLLEEVSKSLSALVALHTQNKETL
jgi:putative phage-type endonuclease